MTYRDCCVFILKMIRRGVVFFARELPAIFVIIFFHKFVLWLFDTEFELVSAVFWIVDLVVYWLFYRLVMIPLFNICAKTNEKEMVWRKYRGFLSCLLVVSGLSIYHFPLVESMLVAEKIEKYGPNIINYFNAEKSNIKIDKKSDSHYGIYYCCFGFSQTSFYVSLRLGSGDQNESIVIRILSELIFQGFVAKFFHVNVFVLEWTDKKALPREWREWAYSIADVNRDNRK
ncbi:MAG: hypothetical protein NXI18_19905 [Alphaproteobacteria bacterium]|nr:hypothetical protein [Alphaproteobacteria bacterium]